MTTAEILARYSAGVLLFQDCIAWNRLETPSLRRARGRISSLAYASSGHTSSCRCSTVALRSCYLSSRYMSCDVLRLGIQKCHSENSQASCSFDFRTPTNSMCFECSDCCSLHDARCMNAPSNVAVADHVLRFLRRPGLGRFCVTLCSH